jgi:hypothetical protein
MEVEMKTVGEIEQGIPVAAGTRSELGDNLFKIEPNESFLTDHKRETVYSHARYHGKRVAIRLLRKGPDAGKLRVWCLGYLKTTIKKGKK